MIRVDVTATREGRYWLVEVPGVGFTQARRRGEIGRMARDLIAAVTGAPARVRVRFR